MSSMASYVAGAYAMIARFLNDITAENKGRVAQATLGLPSRDPLARFAQLKETEWTENDIVDVVNLMAD